MCEWADAELEVTLRKEVSGIHTQDLASHRTQSARELIDFAKLFKDVVKLSDKYGVKMLATWSWLEGGKESQNVEKN